MILVGCVHVLGSIIVLMIAEQQEGSVCLIATRQVAPKAFVMLRPGCASTHRDNVPRIKIVLVVEFVVTARV